MNVEWVLSSSALILFVVLVRFAFRKKIRPCLRYMLWLAVAVRLLVPFSFWGTTVSILNLLPERTAEGAGLTPAAAGGQQEGQGNAGKEEDFSAQLELKESNRSDHIPNERMESMFDDMIFDIPSDEAPRQTAGNDTQTGFRETGFAGGKAEAGRLLWYVWLSGVGVCGITVSAVNWNYSRRLRRSRVRIGGGGFRPEESRLPVYFSQIVQTPCLSGLFHPAVYVTEYAAGEEKTLAYVLCHENTHYRQHDNWWALVRTFCLCLHWFNPLVWLAAHLSEQDGELACDERALEILGDGERTNYGKALLELGTGRRSGISGWQISTTMGGSRRQMKERLQMIMHVPERNVGVQALLLLFSASVLTVTFTGRDAPWGERHLAAERQEPGRDVLTEPESTVMSGRKEGFEETGGPGEPEYYRERIPISLGGEEYVLLCEGRIFDSGLYGMESIKLEDAKNADTYADTVWTAEIAEAYHQDAGSAAEGAEQEIRPVRSPSRDGGIIVADLNFDGWNDVCFQGWQESGTDIPYYCMLWNRQEQRFEYSVMLYNVEVDLENQRISGTREGENGQQVTVYYRYGEDGHLHMVQYVEEDRTAGALFEHLELTYVEDGGAYTLPATVDGSNLSRVMAAMAKQALEELYLWTGEKVEAVYFQVSDLGGVTFAMSQEDMEHSRIFFSRYYGADTVYNLSGYEKMISSIYIESGRSVWYSPVLWQVTPDGLDGMTDEEVVRWYFERIPTGEYGKVKTMEQRFEGVWTVQSESGSWFEVGYDEKLREVSDVTGPYPDIPQH